MNTPDIEVCEICHGFGNNGADDAQCLNCGGSGKCDDTPDTEGEDYRIFTSRICEIAGEHPAGWKLMIENAVKNRDSSHTTYWKERVRKEVESLKKEPWSDVDEVDWNQALDTLLDNLK